MSNYYVNDMASTTGTYTRKDLAATTDGLDYHYALEASVNLNNSVLQNFNVVVLSTGEGEGGQVTNTPGDDAAGLEFITHSGTLDLASIKTHFIAGATSGSTAAATAFTRVISQLIMGASTAAPDSAATTGTGKTIDVLKENTTWSTVINAMTLTQTAANLDALADAFYKDGRTPGDGSSGSQTITLETGDTMHFTVSISLSATGGLREDDAGAQGKCRWCRFWKCPQLRWRNSRCCRYHPRPSRSLADLSAFLTKLQKKIFFCLDALHNNFKNSHALIRVGKGQFPCLSSVPFMPFFQGMRTDVDTI